jgi:hypothetical protein
MKIFLQKLQDIQDECIGRVKKQEISQLPDKVAGATVHSVSNHISREEWDKMRENIAKHSKDWRRFKNDPNKVVLEKNFFINCLSLTQGFFIFRPMDNDGKTYIKVNDFFFGSKPKDSQPYLLATFLVLACALILTSVYYSPWLSILGIFFIPLAILAERKRIKGQKIKEKEWQESFTNHPGVILPPAVFSKKETVFAGSSNLIMEKNVRESLVKISLEKSPFFNDYQAILSKTLDIARNPKGQIAWLWQFGPHSLLGDDFSITYQDFIGRTLDQTLCINIDVRSSNILPIIETENSFIFCLDSFSEEMEKHYVIPAGIVETLKSKTMNPSKTVATDDLFRLNEI